MPRPLQALMLGLIVGLIVGLGLAILSLSPTPLRAQPNQPSAPAAASAPINHPWREAPVTLEADRLVVVSLGRADRRLGRLSAIRRSARRHALERGRGLLGAYVSQALTRVHASPVHILVARRCVTEGAAAAGSRILVDGDVLTTIAMPLDCLRSRAGLRGVPWRSP